MNQVSRAAATRIDEVEPLWKALHAHHVSRAQHLEAVVPFRSPDSSWAIRRAQYADHLAGERPSALFLAEQDGRIVGYAMVRNVEAGPTLQTADTVGHLESLAVLPDYRCAGLGRRLLDAVVAVQRDWGTTEMTVNVISGNVRAEQIYRRMGLLPYTTSFVGRVV